METLPLASLLSRLRDIRPLVHHITNSVTINDCANVTLSVGAAPVMADAHEEVAEMAGIADVLVLNIGTLTSTQVDSMLLAGRTANSRDIPIILDPVGAGATAFRTSTALRLLEDLDIAVLKGNAGEIGMIAGSGGRVRGVDSEGLMGDPEEICTALADRLGCIVAMSAPIDVVADGSRVALVENGHPLMGSVSGTGCMVSSVAGAFAAVTRDRFSSAVAAFATFGLAGETAATCAAGPGSFRAGLLDALAGIDPGHLDRGARVRLA